MELGAVSPSAQQRSGLGLRYQETWQESLQAQFARTACKYPTGATDASRASQTWSSRNHLRAGLPEQKQSTSVTACQGHLPCAEARTAHLRPDSQLGQSGATEAGLSSAVRQTLSSPGATSRSDCPALAALPPRLPCWRVAGPVEGLPAPGSRRGGGCPVSTPARLLQRGLAEFSVGEAHQAAAITAGPAYGSHFRGTGGRRQARCGGRGLELRRGRRSPAEAEHRARSRASAQQETSGRSGGAACSAAETAPPRRACALPPPPLPPAWLAVTGRRLR